MKRGIKIFIFSVLAPGIIFAALMTYVYLVIPACQSEIKQALGLRMSYGMGPGCSPSLQSYLIDFTNPLPGWARAVLSEDGASQSFVSEFPDGTSRDLFLKKLEKAGFKIFQYENTPPSEIVLPKPGEESQWRNVPSNTVVIPDEVIADLPAIGNLIATADLPSPEPIEPDFEINENVNKASREINMGTSDEAIITIQWKNGPDNTVHSVQISKSSLVY